MIRLLFEASPRVKRVQVNLRLKDVGFLRYLPSRDRVRVRVYPHRVRITDHMNSVDELPTIYNRFSDDSQSKSRFFRHKFCFYRRGQRKWGCHPPAQYPPGISLERFPPLVGQSTLLGLPLTELETTTIYSFFLPCIQNYTVLSP